MKSNKPIARPFQKWVCNMIKSVNNTGSYSLEQERELKEKYLRALENEATLRERLQKSATTYSNYQNDLARASYHNAVLDNLDKKSTNYIVYIKDFEPNEQNEKQDIVKIGWSNDLRERSRTLSERLGNCQILYAVECHFNVQFEKQLHKNMNIENLTARYTMDINHQRHSYSQNRKSRILKFS